MRRVEWRWQHAHASGCEGLDVGAFWRRCVPACTGVNTVSVDGGSGHGLPQRVVWRRQREGEAIDGEHESWLRQFLTMRCLVPSHVTFDRVLSLHDPVVVTLRVIKWIKAFRETYGEEIVTVFLTAPERFGSFSDRR